FFDRNLLAYLGSGDELHALGGHLFEATIDDVLLELEFRDAVAEQSADTVGFFVDRDGVAGTAELLRGGESGGAGTNDRNFLSGAMFRRFRPDPPFEKSALDNVFFVLLDRDRRRVDPQHARGLARCGANSAGTLRKIIGGVQLAHRVFPASAIDEVVPVRNEIAYWASGLAERDAAIHAAGALLAKLFFREVLVNLEPVVHAFG